MRGGVGLGCKLVWQAMVTCMLFMLAWSARAAEITYDKRYPTAGYISIKGDIEDFDRQKFSALLAEHPDTRMVVLESPGGRLGPALEIGAIIRQTRMWTAALGECASACAYIWMAGKPLVVSADTELGFHSPYNAQDNSSISSVGNALVGAYLNQLGYPANVITYATSAKPNEMQWLTPRDAVLLGLDITYVTNLQQLLSTLAGTAVQTTQEHEAGPAQTSAAQPDDGSGDDESYDVPTSPPDEEWKLAIYKNVDFWGGDKYPKGLTLQSRRDCMEQCANDTDCKLFTYNESYKSCFIKTRMDMVVMAENLTSGVVYKPGKDIAQKPSVRSDFRLIPGRAWVGPYNPFDQPQARTIDRCLRTCEKDGDCEYLTFNPSSRSLPACIVRRMLAMGTTDERKATSFRRERLTLSPSEIIDLKEFQVPVAGTPMVQ